MKVPSYLSSAKVSDPKPDYKWDVQINNRILASDADSKPALSDALGKISLKAAFALAVAWSEWIVARLSNHVDVSDALMRVEAAWAATVDARYAKIPDPAKMAPNADRQTSGPLYLAMLLLSNLHQRYLEGNATKIYMRTLALGILADHVAGKNATFKKWVPAVLKRAQQQHPSSKKPLAKEAPVARDLFESDAPPDKAGVAASQAQLLAQLDPARNPYLRPAADLISEGVSADPYPGKK